MVTDLEFVLLVPNGTVPEAVTSHSFTETQRRAILHIVRNAGVTPPAPATCPAPDAGMGTLGLALGAGTVLRAPVIPVGHAGNGVVMAPLTERTRHVGQAQKVVAYQAAKSQGYTGDPCPSCQGMRVKRNGSCLLCLDCHSTTGCS